MRDKSHILEPAPQTRHLHVLKLFSSAFAVKRFRLEGIASAPKPPFSKSARHLLPHNCPHE
jgi:hypothetical protein